LEALRRLNNVTHVVLSCGGNDVYLGASIQAQLGLSLLPLQAFRRRRVGREFCSRLNTIIRGIKQVKPAALVIPIIVYHPHHGFSLSGLNGGCVGVLGQTLQRLLLPTMVRDMVIQFLRLAEVYRLPVIDLSRTMNPNNVTHYGSMDKSKIGEFVPWSGAEPSDVSQLYIAGRSDTCVCECVCMF
jgi:hypothetical protein